MSSCGTYNSIWDSPKIEPGLESFDQISETANYQLSCRRACSSVGSWLFHLFVQNKRFRVRVPAGARKWQQNSCMFMFIHGLRIFPGFFLIFLLGRSELCLVFRVGGRKSRCGEWECLPAKLIILVGNH